VAKMQRVVPLKQVIREVNLGTNRESPLNFEHINERLSTKRRHDGIPKIYVVLLKTYRH
jgi:hypothetical protein